MFRKVAMGKLWLVFGVSAFAIYASFGVQGSESIVFTAAVICLWSLYLIVPHLRQRLVVWGQVCRAKLARRDRRPVILLDGSNIMHWKQGKPDLAPVRDVVRELDARGYRAGVVFDANVGYKLEGFYQNHRSLARKLGLSEDLVMVVEKGQPADELLLQAARDYNARVVTNDRFRDWAAAFPDVAKPGFLISGGYRGGALQLNL